MNENPRSRYTQTAPRTVSFVTTLCVLTRRTMANGVTISKSPPAMETCWLKFSLPGTNTLISVTSVLTRR